MLPDRARDAQFELMLLGTGTSSAVPILPCVTDPEQKCKTCLSDAKEDERGNTSAIVQVRANDGNMKTILIDCGKTFYRDSLKHFPKRGLRKANAMYGLDDLRAWTMRSIQDCIDVYTNEDTYQTVCNVFPYMVDSSKASGGGDVPSFRWHIITPGEQFDVAGVPVIAADVEHGLAAPRSISGDRSPFHCLSYIFPPFGIYMADVSRIPEESYKIIDNALEGKRPSILVLDCLKSQPHLSHFGLDQSLEASYRIKAKKTLFVGFGHERTHNSWIEHIDRNKSVDMDISPGFDGQVVEVDIEGNVETK
ncbi:hypothetical protein E3Q12_02405 [Wallemia mellicola]|nr:hypothetical protein E3Q12_02405 [Wallemia mellicola]